MNKIKHSKYRNTGILWEILVRQITSDTISGKESPAVNIIKKYFSKTELLKEYKLYQTLLNSKSLNESKAETLLNTVLDLSTRLNRSKLRNEKYNLIKEIRENYNLDNFFKTKINNYSQYAAIYNLIEIKNFNEFIEPSQVVDNRITLLEYITRKEINKDKVEEQVIEEYLTMDKGTRMLVYHTLLEKFNKKYVTLNTQQKNILKEYINNISNTPKLKEFVNENFNKLFKELTNLIPSVTDKTTQIKLSELLNLLKPLDKTQNVKDEHIISLLQYHQLINELKITK
jgi:hypothetical protein